MDRTLPLLAARDPAAPLAWCGGLPISAARFLADVAQQAARLPAEGPLVNLCLDRYRFSVGFAAALTRAQTSLLPPDALPDTLARLRAAHPTLYGLADDATLQTPGVPLLQVLPPGAGGAAQAVPRIAASLAAACLLTSGSTGVPQPHVKTWGALVANIGAEAARLAEFLERPTLAGLTLVATVPAQHSYGFESSVLLALLGGAAFDAGRPFYPADIVQALARVPRPRALVTTPFHLKTLLLAGLELPPTDLVLCATAPLSPQLALQAERGFGGPLIEIYGCTEAGQVATRRTVREERWTTLGDLRLRRDGAFEGRGDGLEGGERFVVEGGHVLAPTPLADVLQLEDAQRFRLLGRAHDLIHVAGRRSSLAHLNYHLNSIEGVQDGAFWLPADVADGVVRPVALVVAPGASAARIIAALRERLEPVFVPRRVLHVQALPRAATGKLSADALQRFATEQLARRSVEDGHG